MDAAYVMLGMMPIAGDRYRWACLSRHAEHGLMRLQGRPRTFPMARIVIQAYAQTLASVSIKLNIVYISTLRSNRDVLPLKQPHIPEEEYHSREESEPCKQISTQRHPIHQHR